MSISFRAGAALIVTLVGYLVWPILNGVPLKAQPTEKSHVRELIWSPIAPLERQLLPDDDVVIVTRSNIDRMVPSHLLTRKEVIDDISVRADAVLVFSIVSIDTVLAQEGSFVDTRLITTVRDVWRSSEQVVVRKDQRLEIHLPGGELRIGKVIVRAGYRLPWKPPAVDATRSYVAFMQRDPSTGVFYPIHQLLYALDDKVGYHVEFSVHNMPINPLEGLRLEELAKSVREAKTSWLQEGRWVFDPDR